MKSYHEMIQWVVDQVDHGKLRYYEWPAILAITEAYGIPQDIVFDDVKFEKEFREQAKKAQRTKTRGCSWKMPNSRMIR